MKEKLKIRVKFVSFKDCFLDKYRYTVTPSIIENQLNNSLAKESGDGFFPKLEKVEIQSNNEIIAYILITGEKQSEKESKFWLLERIIDDWHLQAIIEVEEIEEKK
jgi:hypothetical protein